MDRVALYTKEAHTVEETGLSESLLIDLVLKHTFFAGTPLLADLAAATRLHNSIIHTLYRELKKEQLCETKSMIGEDYQITLTTRGRSMTQVALEKSHYAGPAPVPLEQYNKVIAQQAVHINQTAESLKSALGDLVLSDDVIADLGTALVSGGTLLLYGATGNGKTSIAERLHRVFDDMIYIPYAVEVGGQIITVFDSLVHRAEKEPEDRTDRRWVLCRRPLVKVGGEMRIEMLEPRVDEHTRICVGPLQMKANNGILLIDDFGRQHISPRELLNRWIVPLDRRTDVLSLWTGMSFEIPFELFVVFATNLSLSDLAEEAFLRRLKNKIKIDAPADEIFKKILERVCREKNLAYSPEIEQYLLDQCMIHSAQRLRSCFPVDLTQIVCGVATFERRPPVLDKTNIDRAMRIYFAH
ncbi:MAG TPA: AAA family ATPase [Bryobacteraceae bacterium]|nr:AAA family ATPase [Bryobacteraceae bacterium]